MEMRCCKEKQQLQGSPLFPVCKWSEARAPVKQRHSASLPLSRCPKTAGGLHPAWPGTLDFPTFSRSSWFPPRSVLPISLWPWQNSWSWFHRKVTRSSDVIFRGRLFVPSPSNPSNLITLSPWRHHRTATPRDFTKQSASPWNYGTFWMFRSFSLGCITRRKGIKKASCRNGTRLLVLLCFLGCQTLIRGCNFWSHFECHATDSEIIRTRLCCYITLTYIVTFIINISLL